MDGVYIHIYIYVCIQIHVCIYIYIYIERERDMYMTTTHIYIYILSGGPEVHRHVGLRDLFEVFIGYGTCDICEWFIV